MQNKTRQRTNRFDHLTDDVIRERWLALRPRVGRTMSLFIAAAVTLFLVNHFVHFLQNIHDYLGIAFQICAVFSVCLAFMYAMTFVFVRALTKQ